MTLKTMKNQPNSGPKGPFFMQKIFKKKLVYIEINDVLKGVKTKHNNYETQEKHHQKDRKDSPTSTCSHC